MSNRDGGSGSLGTLLVGAVIGAAGFAWWLYSEAERKQQQTRQQRTFWQDAWQTLRFAGLSVTTEMVLGLAIALLLNEPLRGRSSLRVISLLPWALPTTVMALGWRWIFNDPYGPITEKMKN